MGVESFKVTRSEEMNPAGNLPEVVILPGEGIELDVQEVGRSRNVTITSAGTGKGKTGKDGAAGADGAPGLRGDRGVPGEQGPQGEAGADGAKGDKGDEGRQGPPGEQGPQGATGPQGPKGNKGDPGQNGLPGERGAPGADGADALALTGSVIGFLGSVVPDGYLALDGASYASTHYPSLAAVLGGGETFTLPNTPGSIVKL